MPRLHLPPFFFLIRRTKENDSFLVRSPLLLGKKTARQIAFVRSRSRREREREETCQNRIRELPVSSFRRVIIREGSWPSRSSVASFLQIGIFHGALTCDAMRKCETFSTTNFIRLFLHLFLFFSFYHVYYYKPNFQQR